MPSFAFTLSSGFAAVGSDSLGSYSRCAGLAYPPPGKSAVPLPSSGPGATFIPLGAEPPSVAPPMFSIVGLSRPADEMSDGASSEVRSTAGSKVPGAAAGMLNGRLDR